MEVKEILKKVVDIIHASLPNIEWKIFLFGSQAKHTNRPTSDIDIAIMGKTPISAEKILDIRENIDHLPTLRSIDIVDLQQTSPQFRDRILKNAKLLS